MKEHAKRTPKNKKRKQEIKMKIKQRKKNQYDHLFRLVAMPTKRPCKYEDVQVNFAPIQVIPNIQEEIIPIFNSDGRYWTDSFILALKKDYFMTNPRKQREKFDKKIQQKVQYDFPTSQNKPIGIINSLYRYCQICKARFQQYYSHIKTDSHLLTLKKSRANTYINELIQTYPKQQMITFNDRISLQENETVYSKKIKKIRKRDRTK